MNNKVKSEQKLNLKKNQEISLTIEDFTKEGEGLGKYQGFPFFVKDTVIGDEVRVSITKLKKNYGYARLVEIATPSKDRVTPPCPVARQCGGCKLQQISYEKQLSFKKSLVEGCLTRIGGFEKEDIDEPQYLTGAMRGTAYHRIFELLDMELEEYNQETVKKMIDGFVDAGLIDRMGAASVM